MGFHVSDSCVRVDRFKPRGKWYDTFSIDMEEHYNDNDLHDAVQKCIEKEGYKMDDWIFVCLEPYHKHSHPVMLKDRRSGT